METNETKKSLNVNCALCDATALTEEKLQCWSRVHINCATVLTSEESSVLFAKYGVSTNCATVLKAPAGTKVVIQNGSGTLGAGEPPEDPTFLIVNGSLTVEKGAEQCLLGYVHIVVNGSILCPESLSGALSKMTVNGSSTVYPDDAVVMPSTLRVDRVFILRAKAQKYFVRKRVVVVDPNLDLERLANSGATLLTKGAVVAEPYLEAVLPLLPDGAKVAVVPENTYYVSDDAQLTPELVRKSGGKLYVAGDLSVPGTVGELLGQLSFLQVAGDVNLPEKLLDAFNALDAEVGGSIHTYRGRVLAGLPSVTVDMAALEGDGLTVRDCGTVRIAEDVPYDLIVSKLRLADCGVLCAPSQRSAVEQVSSDVFFHESDPDKDEEEDDDNKDPNAVFINCATYTF